MPLWHEPPNWSAIEPVAVTGPASCEGTNVRLMTTAGDLVLSFHAGGMRLRFGTASGRDYGMIEALPEPLCPQVSHSDDRTVLESGDLRLVLETAPLAFRLERAGRLVLESARDGHFVRERRLPPFARHEGGFLLSLDLPTASPVHGLGEKWGRLDLRGQILRSHNEDALGVNAERAYKNTPFAWSPDGWSLFVHTPCAVTHAIGHAPWSHRSYVLHVEDSHLDLFLSAGADGRDLLARHTALVGRACTPPLWSLGIILSKAYYRDAEEILAVAGEVRRRGMPCDVITFDGRAWQDTPTRFSFAFDPKRYPDPRPVLDRLRDLGFRICVWEYPCISVANPDFDELAARGWLLRDGRTGEVLRYRWDMEPFGAVLTPLPDSGLIDFTHPEAYDFWRDQHKALFDLGIDMLKPDFGEQVPDHALAANGASGRELHNVYSLLYNRCCHEAARLYAKDGGFLFSRSGWTGSGRYPSLWGGDPQADFGGLAASIRGALSWGMSGGPFHASDVGGFYGDRRDPVLYVRWMQAAVFSAHMRLHGIGAREPWSYGAEAEAAAMAAMRLRYRLIPYLARAIAESTTTGLPVQRAMTLAFPDDPAAWHFEEQFLCGPDLLVAPCLDPEGAVTVYLPQGEWRRFPDRTPFEGGKVHRLRLSLDEMAVFARKGTQIPLGPEVVRTEELGGEARTTDIWTA